MSTVVVFPADKVQAGHRPQCGSAQVFIFTGVRYERLDYVPPSPGAARRRKLAPTGAEAPFGG